MRTPVTLEINARGIYELRWSEKATHGGWRSMRRSTRTADLDLAERFKAKFLAGRDEPAPAAVTVTEALDEYMREWSIPRGNDRTDGFVLAPVRKGLGAAQAKALTQADIDSYVERRRRGLYGREGVVRPVKDATIARELTALQAALNRCTRLSREFRFAKPTGAEIRILWLTEAQEADILSKLHMTTRSVGLFFRMGVAYGARRGAMLDLRFPDQVSFVSGTIDFNRPNARRTRKRRPVVPMTPEIRADLEVLFQQRTTDEPVLDRRTAEDFAAFMASIDYAWVTPHVLKHTAITLMLRAKVDPLDVAKATATDLKTIEKVYRHHSRDELLSFVTSRRKF